MKKLIVAVPVVICLLFFPPKSYAQNAAEDFKKITDAYAAEKEFSMNVEYRLFSDYTTQQAEQVMKGSFKRKDDYYFSDMLGIITMQNNKFLIAVDSASKIIVVSGPAKSAESGITVMDIEKLLPIYNKIEYTDLGGGKIKYYLELINDASSQYHAIELVIDTQTYFIQKMILYFKGTTELSEEGEEEKPRIEIIYSNVDTTSEIQLTEFSENKYIQNTGQGLEGAGEYSNYQIIDHRLPENIR